MPRVLGFRSSGRPSVSVRVRLLRLMAEAEVVFLIDTGADRTIIHLEDRWAFDNADVRTGDGLARGAQARGIGGVPLAYAVESAECSFTDDDGAQRRLPVDVRIALDPAARGVPSLLGRDLLDLMTFCISEREITLDW